MPLPYRACIHALYVKPQFMGHRDEKGPAREGRSFYVGEITPARR